MTTTPTGPAPTDAAGLASVASAVMHSLAVRARAGESRRALDKLSKSALDLICGKQAKRRSLSAAA